MEEQRASLAEKIEALENRIVQTVEGAREAVADTVETVKDTVSSSVATVKDTVSTSVETVKDTVSSSVESVKETFDLPAQTQRHPWTLFGCSVAAGFAGGWVLFRALEGNRRSALPPAAAYHPAGNPGSTNWASRPQASYSNGAAAVPAPVPPPAPPQPAAESGPSWISELGHKFEPELNKLKGLAIGALVGVVRDMVTKSIPEPAQPQVREMLDNVTSKLGGEPIRGEVLQQFMPDMHGTGHQRSSGLYESEAEAVNS